MSDSPKIIYGIDAYPQNVEPYDPATGEDIQDLGPGYIVVSWVPASRLEDLDRNDLLRREVTAELRAKIAEVE
jgi:hypothetical protein